MKTLNEIYEMITSSEELKEKFLALKGEAEVVSFVESLGGKATAEEIAAFLKEKQSVKGELSDDDLDQVAGGISDKEGLWSVISFGFACIGTAVYSAVKDGAGGSDGNGGTYELCNNVEY